MTTALTIKGWKEHFQISQNTRVGVWGKLPIPIKLTGERFRILMSTSKGRDTYAVFLALAAVAANMPVRGVLAGSDGPLSDFAMHVKTGVPLKALKEAIVSLKEIGWLCETEWTPSSLRADSERAPSVLRVDSESAPSVLRPSQAKPSVNGAKPSQEEPKPVAGSNRDGAGLAGWLNSIGVDGRIREQIAFAPGSSLEMFRREWADCQRGSTNPVRVFVARMKDKLGIKSTKQIDSKVREAAALVMQRRAMAYQSNKQDEATVAMDKAGAA